MIDKILQFPQSSEAFANRKKIADYMRRLADYIENQELEYPPQSFAIVLTSEAKHEVCHRCHTDFRDILEAGKILMKYAGEAKMGDSKNSFDRV